jgi:hypothetical protein
MGRVSKNAETGVNWHNRPGLRGRAAAVLGMELNHSVRFSTGTGRFETLFTSRKAIFV